MRYRQKPAANVPRKDGGHKTISPSMGKARRVSPGMAWTGFIGINESSYEGLKRSRQFIWEGFIGEDVYA